MSKIKTFIGFVAMLAIVCAGAVQAGDKTEKMIKAQEEAMKDEPYPQSVKSPTPDMKKQAKTEKMLKEQERQAKKEYPKPSITPTAPDMEKQKKTEEMVKQQEAQARDEPR